MHHRFSNNSSQPQAGIMTQDPRWACLLTFPIFLHSQTPAVTQSLQYPNLASCSWYKSLLHISWVPSSASLEYHPAEQAGQLPQWPWLPPCWSSPCTLLQPGSPSLCGVMAHNGTEALTLLQAQKILCTPHSHHTGNSLQGPLGKQFLMKWELSHCHRF